MYTTLVTVTSLTFVIVTFSVVCDFCDGWDRTALPPSSASITSSYSTRFSKSNDPGVFSLSTACLPPDASMDTMSPVICPVLLGSVIMRNTRSRCTSSGSVTAMGAPSADPTATDSGIEMLDALIDGASFTLRTSMRRRATAGDAMRAGSESARFTSTVMRLALWSKMPTPYCDKSAS